MRLPIDTNQITILATGDLEPVRVFGSNEHKTDAEGNLLYRLPVLIMGTGERTDPSARVNLVGPVESVPRGPINLVNLTVSQWTMKGSDGIERSGYTLRADGVEAA